MSCWSSGHRPRRRSRSGGSPTSVVVGATRPIEVLRIDDALEPRPARWTAERVARHAWHLRTVDGFEERRLTVDDDGRPLLADALSWPLEA